uniref:Uncharacterized protein n=1 Tax=Glycine max TaxID=3847 RepID=A0A0R0GWM2_SOYBN
MFIWTQELGLKIVADSCNNSLGILAFNVILAKCRALLSNFLNSRVCFSERQVNYVVHSLARASRFYACNHTFDIIFTCIHVFIINEIP